MKSKEAFLFQQVDPSSKSPIGLGVRMLISWVLAPEARLQEDSGQKLFLWSLCKSGPSLHSWVESCSLAEGHSLISVRKHSLNDCGSLFLYTFLH